ncbi:AAA family ATPase [Nitriliruptor alkaliphilus]|uniref:AAA family ATPase n=1 Tax=Nitriliruptor alkaliphilus TaxID=427918 RepID=UPI0006961390|nr:SMC family ATPase [Nitriliruptor alkaliphilus]
MRPLFIELEGIGSFRERTELDLAGVDLFALSGPTGAGKTTLMVDAMMLALYGTVPRYEDRRMVAPVITQGANEGRVRLTFSVGNRTFTATRVVRRTKQGATTKEARLEETTGGGSVVRAGSADEVSDAVASLLGLSFDQFCRSVVLPQGAFDRFLFAKPAERGDLLLQLLDLRLHEEVGKRARVEATQASARADAAQRRLDGDLAGADPSEVDRLEARVVELTALGERCREVQDELDTLREHGGKLAAEATEAANDRDALASLRRPEDVDALADATRAASQARTEAEQRRATAAEALDAAEATRAELPAPEILAALARTADEVAAAEAALPELVRAADEAHAAATRAASELETAERGVHDAEAALDAARRRELVHALTDGLHAGDDCPVCGSPLAEEPDAGDDTATAAATTALGEAQAGRTAAAASVRDADRHAASSDERRRAAERRLAEAHDARTAALAAAGVADTDAADALVTRVAAADAAVTAARTDDRAARQAEAEARRADEAARAGEQAAWGTLDAARDAVARLGPPSPDRRDLAAAWDTLLAWAETTRPAAIARADEAAAAVVEARERYATVNGALREECARAGVDVPAGSAAGVAVAGALATAQAQHATLAQRIAQVAEVTAERDAARADQQVAEHLGKLLRADGFERWLLSRALTRLIAGASALLRELSSGAYSLALDATNQFLVLDHRNADEPRSVRSLSGGERFLASLALALALADHVAELAADGAARLESLFLDEGFGTLDPDTLDVVAAALEELGARGRVVGIVTHVRDLAERLPVRFEVRKGPTGSSVRRIDEGAPVTADDLPTADTSQVVGTGSEEVA